MSFLNAEWRKLVLANYLVDPEVLIPYLPAKTAIDIWQNKCYVSLVGFMFLNTKMLNMKIPWHINFEEVNLRFYVKHIDGNLTKRGVVFIKEIVPKPMLSLVANKVYHEHYETLKMSHLWQIADSQKIEYCWNKNNNWNKFSVEASNKPLEIGDNSEEEFITEHYWGYTKISHSKTTEYEVKHPKWAVYEVLNHKIQVDFGAVYGQHFSFLNTQKPHSVMLAEGSEISVENNRILD